MNAVEIIKSQISKKATIFQTGGFKPTNSTSESWIGKIYLFKENEEIPIDNVGRQMIPLAQINVENIHEKPKSISDTKLITIFISQDYPLELAKNGENWLLREYTDNDKLVVKTIQISNNTIKPFPLKPKPIDKDYPVWDGGGLTSDMEDKIIELEKSGEIENYCDITHNEYGHKIGGYPSYCQSGINFGIDFEFTLQIASDAKANLNIVDNGTIFLAKNAKTQEWKYYCDFY